MSLFRRFFGLSTEDDEIEPTESFQEDSSARDRDERTAFELIDEGLSAWAVGDMTLAEAQIRSGLAAYRELGGEQTEFALGRLGAFLLDQNRLEEAAEALEEALESGTAIPAIGSDYLSSIERRKETGQWTAKHAARTESILRQGCRQVASHRSDKLSIAYSTLARFLISEARPDDAEREIRIGLRRAPQDASLWNSLIDVMYKKRDAPGLVAGVIDRPSEIAERDRPWSELWRIADDEAREGNQQFAEELVRTAAERARVEGDAKAYWAAIGVLGRVIERDERVSEAIETWRTAFEGGSQDPLTINRLSMHLERRKEHPAAIAIIEKGLGHGLPSNVEEQLRKRLERCRARIEGRARKETRAFSVRTGPEEMDLLFQTRVSPAIHEFSVHNGIGRSWGLRRSSGSWSAWSMETGELLGRREDLPRLRNLKFASDGHAIGATQTGPVDECVTELGFLSPEGELIGQAALPNGLSQISSETEGIWYLGCRDGCLYAYSVGGEHLWTWWTPGSREYKGDRYMRPCPYYVTAAKGGAVIASFGTVFGISSNAEVMWTFETAEHEPERTTRVRLLVSPDEASPASFDELGLPTTADDNEVRVAYRRRAMETHPDRNPHLTDASEQFQRVHRAYEAIMAHEGDITSDDIYIDVSLSFGDSWGSVSSLVTGNELTHIGTAHGRIYAIDTQGNLVGEHALGKGIAVPYVASDGEITAAWCDETLFFLDGVELRHLAECDRAPDGVGAFANGLYVRRDKRVSTVDRTGKEAWVAEFAKTINAIAVDNDRLVVAGGVVAAFRRSVGVDQ